MRKLLIGLAVLAVLFVAADRVAVAVAQRQVSNRVAAAYDLRAKPQVTIRGFPFLTQAVAGDYHEIDVSAASVTVGGATLSDLHARFTGVHASLSQVLGGGASTVTADHASGSALAGFAQLSRYLPAGVKLTPDGKALKVSGDLSYQGIRVPVSAVVAVSVTSAGIKVTPKDVSVSGGLSVPPSLVAGRLGFVIPLQALPLHLRLTRVTVTPGGLRLGVSAQHVHFARACCHSPARRLAAAG